MHVRKMFPQMMDNIAAMHRLCDEIVAERKAHPRPDVDHLLNVMLFAKDPATEKHPPNAWKPFGTGIRACIGRYLAEQEIVMAMAMVLQRFIVEQADPDCKLSESSPL